MRLQVFRGTISRSAVRILVSFSAVGNIIASTFVIPRGTLTLSETKFILIGLQVGLVIGQQMLVPIWKVLIKESKFKTPSGALLVNWIVSVIIIAAVPHNDSAFRFVITMFTYGYALVISEHTASLLVGLCYCPFY
jgi:hypothetical protein